MAHQASSTKGERRDLTPPCNCHVLYSEDWPWENGKIQVAFCMEWCPYCGREFYSCFDLQDHLDGEEYQERNLTVSMKIKTLPAISRIRKSDIAKVEPKTFLCLQTPAARQTPSDSNDGQETNASGEDMLGPRTKEAMVEDMIRKYTAPFPSKSSIGNVPQTSTSRHTQILSQTQTINIVSTLSSVPMEEKVKMMLNLLDGFDLSTRRLLENLNLSPGEAKEDIPINVKDMWIQSTTT